MVMAAWVLATSTARAQSLVPEELGVIDCSADVGDDPPGSLGWILADKNNFFCGYEGWLLYYGNPAMAAATAANHAQGSVLFRDFIGDPFREPALRWAAQGRGEYMYIPSWKEGQTLLGSSQDAVLLSPVVSPANPGPFPGIVIPCHSCFVSAKESDQFAIAESLAEAGYLVLIAYVGGNNVEATVEATDYFLSASNPWQDRLDGARLGIAGHSGAAGLASTVGNTDPRFSAAVAFDGGNVAGLELRTPTMIQVADYSGNLGSLLVRPDVPDEVPSLLFPPDAAFSFLPYGPNTIRHTRPVPTGKYTFFDAFKAAGVDTMQVAIRATTHIDSGRPAGGAFSTFGEMVGIYYALAWFDQYVRDGANDALSRLTATDTFDASADVYSIGTGFFEPLQAKNAGSVEAGNVPIKIAGISIRNRLSFWYPTRYFLNGGTLECEDVRNDCP